MKINQEQVGELLLGQKIKPKHSVFPKGMGTDSPSWVAFDKQGKSHDTGRNAVLKCYMY